ncbi:hypothetical protein K2X33_05625, partial [bacterium]|nr:hypothetical protein [bacterium]
ANVYSLAQSARNTCCSTFAPYMVNYGQNPSSFDASGGNMPNSQACTDAVKQFEVALAAIDNGTYANQQQTIDWAQNQRVATINCVGQQMNQAGLGTGPNDMFKYYLPAMLIAKKMQNTVPSVNLQGYVAQMQPNGTMVLVPQTATVATSGTTGTLGTNPFVLASSTSTTGTTTTTTGTLGQPQVFQVLPSIPAGY